MKAACQFIPKVTNKTTGEEADSKLFVELNAALGNRDEAIKVYKGAVDPIFVDEVSSEPDVYFDENGEITLHSLSKYYDMRQSVQDRLKDLNKQIGSGKYTYLEALQKARMFNQSEFGDKYLATISKGYDSDDYYLKVVENTSDNRGEYTKAIANHEKVNRLMDALHDAGVMVDFFDSKEVYEGRFSSDNPDLAIDGMYHLIQISRKASDAEKVFMEEAAYFAIASLHNTEQVTRLLNLCKNDDFVKSTGIYSEKDFAEGATDPYITAGKLLARAFNGDLVTGYSGLFSGLVQFIRKIFGKIAPNRIIAIKAEAQELAESIADDFLYNRSADIGEAIEAAATTIYIDRKKNNIQLVDKSRKAIGLLKKTQSSIKKISTKLYTHGQEAAKSFNNRDIIKAVTSVNFQSIDDAGIVTAVVNTIALLTEDFNTVLQDIITCKEYINGEYIPEKVLGTIKVNDVEINYGEKLDEAQTFYETVKELIKAADNFKIDTEALPQVKASLEEAQKALKQLELLVGDIDRFLYNEAVNMAEAGMIKVCGGQDGIKINGKIQSARNPQLLDQDISARELVTTVFGVDANWRQRFFRVFHKLGDYTRSVLNKFFRDSDSRINRRILMQWEGRMNELEDMAKELGFNPKGDLSDFLEKDVKTGEPTIYFLSPYLMSEYDRRRKEIIDKLKKEAKLKGVKASTLIEESEELQEFEEESWVVDENGRYLNPNYKGGVYRNRMYEAAAAMPEDSIERKAIMFADALREYKASVDEILIDTDGKTYAKPLRIPQFEIPTSAEVTWKRTKNIFAAVKANFEVGVDSYELNSTDEGILRTIPIQGVRKVGNPSTKLLETLKLYTSMAERYREIKENMSYLSLMQTLAPERQAVEGISDEAKKLNASGLVEDINKYLYGYTEDSYRESKKYKLINTLVSSLFIAKTLAANIMSMNKNLLQATTINIVRSLTSETYDTDDFIVELFKSIITNHKKIPIIRKFGKRSKAIMNWINGNQGHSSMWRQSKIPGILEKYAVSLPMSIYQKGDEIPQQALYMAALKKQKAYDASKYLDSDYTYDGLQRLVMRGKVKNTTLLDIFRIPKNATASIAVNPNFLKDVADLPDYVALISLLKKLENTVKENEENADNPSYEMITPGDIIDAFGGQAEDWRKALESQRIAYKDDEVGYFSLSQIIEDIKEATKNMVYQEKEVAQVTDNMMSESVEQQGAYYANCKAAILEDIQFKGSAIFMGYAIGAYNAMWNSGYDALKGKYIPSRWDTLLWCLSRVVTKNYYDKNTNSLRVKNTWKQWAACALVALPVVNNITSGSSKWQSIRNTLHSLGYSDAILERMRQMGNDWLAFYLLTLISGMLHNRKAEVEKAKAVYGRGKASRGELKNSSKYTIRGLSTLEEDWMSKMGEHMLGFNSKVLFDTLVKPEISDETALSAIQRFFGKGSGVFQMINKDSMDKEAIRVIEQYADAILNYAQKLQEGDYTNPEIAMRDAMIACGLLNEGDSISKARKLLKAVGSAHQKDRNEVTKETFDDWIKRYNVISKDLKKGKVTKDDLHKVYKNLIGEENNELPKNLQFYATFAPKPALFDTSSYQDMLILSENIRAQALKGLKYDKDSRAYKWTGALAYLSGTVANETASMIRFLSNFKDMASIGLVNKPLLTAVTTLLGIQETITNDEINTWTKLKKSTLDFLLHKIWLETDAYGHIRKPTMEEMEDKESSFYEKRTGLTMRDGFQVLNQVNVMQDMKAK